MSNLNTVEPSQKPLDPTKRVKYSMGLVLGVDEFDQEQLYLMERDQLHHRALHGYGTACGLDVSIHDDSGDTTIKVTSGLAVNPEGQAIRVCEDQCASLNEWLLSHQEDLLEYLGSPPAAGPFSLYLVLCYHECETDRVPVPGAPCRTEDDTMVASRIADHFKLSLTLEPPAQLEEEAVRVFGDFLRRIEITDDTTIARDREEVEDLMRSMVADPGSPPLSPPEIIIPPLPPGEKLYLLTGDAVDIVQAIFRVWVTEVRPKVLKKNKICPEQPEESCVLLAQLDFNLKEIDGIYSLDPDNPDVTITEDDRPVLLHTRLLQEWLLCGGFTSDSKTCSPYTFASLFVVNSTTIRAWVHSPALLTIPVGAVQLLIDDQLVVSGVNSISALGDTNVFELVCNANFYKDRYTRIKLRFDTNQVHDRIDPTRTLADALAESNLTYIDQEKNWLASYCFADQLFLDDLADVDANKPKDKEVLTWVGNSKKWVPAAVVTSAADHHGLVGLEDDDHKQYLLADGSRPLAGNLNAKGHKIIGLTAADKKGDAVPFEQAIKKGDTADGDIKGKYPGPFVVAGLQKRTVSSTAPKINDVLTWFNNKWTPRAVVVPKKIVLPFVTITAVEPVQLELWFNINVPKNAVEIMKLEKNKHLKVYNEMEGNSPFMAEISIRRLIKRSRNRWEVILSEWDGSGLLRFRFFITKINVNNNLPLAKYAAESGIEFIGQDMEGETITAFCRVR